MSNPLSGKAGKRMLVASVLPFALLAACTQAQKQESQQEGSWDSRWASGKELYEKVCGRCHSPEVGVGTAIQGRELPASYVKFIVRNGFNAMPAFPASYIDDQSLDEVAKYISSLPAAAAQQ